MPRKWSGGEWRNWFKLIITCYKQSLQKRLSEHSETWDKAEDTPGAVPFSEEQDTECTIHTTHQKWTREDWKRVTRSDSQFLLQHSEGRVNLNSIL